MGGPLSRTPAYHLLRTLSKGLELEEGLILQIVVSGRPSIAPAYHLLRTPSKGLELEEGLILKPVVSGRQLNRFLHGFWERDQGLFNILSF